MSKGYKFNTKAKATRDVLRVLANSEGIFLKSLINSELGHHKLFSELKNAKYIEPLKNGDKDVWRVTPAFDNAYKNQINCDKQFSRSASQEHALGVLNVVQMIPSTVNQERIQNGKETQTDYNAHKSAYSEKEAVLRQEAIDRYQELQAQYDRTSRLDKVDLRKELDYYRNISSIADSDSPFLRTPDLQATMTRDELIAFRDNLQSHYDSLHPSPQGRADVYYQQSLERLEHIIDYEITETQTITLAIEITTSNYSADEVTLHQNYETITEVKQILLPAR